jgi:tetratricopeptide (TPR) repeat protein
MELTIEQKLQQGVAAHKEGKLQEAERLYRAILQSQPAHPDANHNLGLIAVLVNKAEDALPLFKIALEANPKIEQFWLSYIDALIKEKHFDNAKEVLNHAKKQGVGGKKLNIIKAQLASINEAVNADSENPSQEQLSSLLEHYQNGRFNDAEKLAVSITDEFPNNQFGWKVLGAVLKQTGRVIDSLTAMQKSVKLAPQDAEAHSNLGVTLKELGRLDEAEASYNRAISLKPDYALTHSKLGNALRELGRLEEAEASCRQAIALKPDFALAHSNLGNTLQELGRLDEALASYTQTIALKPDYADAYWNLHGIQKTIQGAEHWIDRCLEVNENHIKARLTKAALRFFQGDRTNFDELMQSELKQHPFMRSFSWVFSLPSLPELHFDKWSFFDAVVKKSITSKPFYEFGVWRASSFRYLIKVFKKGYGFDTFTGIARRLGCRKPY